MIIVTFARHTHRGQTFTALTLLAKQNYIPYITRKYRTLQPSIAFFLIFTSAPKNLLLLN